VAIVGASDKTGPGSYNLMENLILEKCAADVYPVNIRAGEVLGRKAYPSVLDLPLVPDLAVITIPRTAVVQAVKDCAAKGVLAVLVITQGFADADEEGHRLQEKILEAVRGSDTRIIGPNSIGVANAFDHFHTSFQKFDLYAKPNAMLCQSGMFVLASADFSTGMGIGVDLGNAADVGFTEMLSSLGDDSRIKVINAHMEGLTDGPAFIEAASRITREKPIVVFKVGRSEAGAKAAASHSGSMAGRDQAFDAAFRRAGVIRVDTLAEMQDLNKAFLTYPRMRGKRIAVVTLSGGGGIAVVDALEAFGLEPAEPSPETLAAIQAMNPPWLEASHPVDTWMAVLKLGLAKATNDILRLLLDDDRVDGAVVLLNSYKTTGWESLSELVAGAREEARRHPDKPVVFWSFGANQNAVIEKVEADGVTAGFIGPERAARALAGLYHWHHHIKDGRPAAPRRPDGVDRGRADHWMRMAEADARTVWGSEVLDLLDAYGLKTARAVKARNRDDLTAAAAETGYPLVMKVSSEQVVHKSDAGGVRLGIANDDELIAAYDHLLAAIAENVPDAVVDGVFLQPQVATDVEIIIGGVRDDVFGPMVLIGLGGVFTEVIGDVQMMPAPVTRQQAEEMIDRLAGRRLLAGFRGRPPVDLDAAADAVCRVSWLMADHSAVAELDINPLAAGPWPPVAVDARMVLSPARPE
jgi:acetyltransferase